MNKTIKVENLNISYNINGTGKDIILLHGWGQSKEAFLSTIEGLSKKYKVWAIDLPGFGESDFPNREYSIYDYEKIVDSFININQIKCPTIIGHSFGGRIGIIYASKNKNINKLVLTGSAGIKPRRNMIYRLKVFHYKFMKFLCNTPFYCQFKSDLLSSSGSEDYKNANAIMKKVLIKVVNEDLTYLLKKIECPTLLYWGEEDDATPITDGYKMKEIIVNSEIVVIKKMGHYAYLTSNLDFCEKIQKFLIK